MTNNVLHLIFAGDPRKGVPALIVSACMNTNPMMIYFGQNSEKWEWIVKVSVDVMDVLLFSIIECRYNSALAK